MKNSILFVLLVLIVLPSIVTAADFGGNVSQEDKNSFDQILSPVMKVYNFVKYSATVLAVVFLVFAGVSFMISGNDQTKREQSKLMAMYIVVGLIVIWVAPLIVQYVIG